MTGARARDDRILERVAHYALNHDFGAIAFRVPAHDRAILGREDPRCWLIVLVEHRLGDEHVEPAGGAAHARPRLVQMVPRPIPAAPIRPIFTHGCGLCTRRVWENAAICE